MQDEKKSPRDMLLAALKEKVLSLPDKTEDEKASMAYNLIVSSLAPFMVQTKLELRILNESRALEQALGNKIDWFDIAIVANPAPRRQKLEESVKQEAVESSDATAQQPATENQG